MGFANRLVFSRDRNIPNLNIPACYQEISTSDTSTILIICHHIPGVISGQTSQPTPSSVSYVDHSPTPGLERRRADASLIDEWSANQDRFTQDLTDTKMSDVHWEEV